MKTKMIPIILMLLAGAVTSIVCFLSKYEIKAMLLILFSVMLVFFYLGDILRYVYEKYVFPKEEKENEATEVEGEDAVIEKDAGGEDGAVQMTES